MKHGDGEWLEWSFIGPALRDVPVIVMRESWGNPLIVTADRVDAMTNSVGLFWKPTGIYRETQSAMPYVGYVQANPNWLTSLLGGGEPE